MISFYVSRDMLAFNELESLYDITFCTLSVMVHNTRTSDLKRMKALGGRGIQSSGRFFECEDFRKTVGASLDDKFNDGKSVDSGGTINSGGSLYVSAAIFGAKVIPRDGIR